MADSSASKSSVTGHENHWQATANQAGTYEFKTGGTYVDRNIDFIVPSGSATASSSQVSAGSASMAETGFTASQSVTDYYVTQSTTAGSAKGNASVGTAGWITSVTGQADTTSITVNGNGDKLYIPTNSITGSVVDLNAPSVAVSGAATGMTTTDTSSYYVTVSGTPTNGSVKGKATAGSTTGIVASGATNTSNASTITPTVTGSGSKVYIKESTRSNAATSGVTYTEDTTITIPSEGALYIEAGYTPAIKITLDQMLDGKEDTAGTAAADIRNGKIAYNVDGKKLTGTMPNSSVTGSNTTATATATATATNNLVSGTYATSVTTGYTYHIDASASAEAPTQSATKTVSAGYTEGVTATATVTGASKSADSSVYLLDGVITNNTSGGTSTATITSGKQIKIAKGYYTEDKYYTAQAFSSENITGSLSSSITSGYTAPTLVTSTSAGVPYVTLTGNGSMTAGNQYSGTSNADTKYLQVYAGSYSVT